MELPAALTEKWAAEGRLEQETAELDAFFRRTGYPRTPRYYIIKWLTDWVRETGFDGYRVDTAKHFGEETSAALAREAQQAFTGWKTAHPTEVLDDLPFFMMGEVYNYALSGGRLFDFGDREVDYFEFGYDALINFGFKDDARGSLDDLFSTYAAALQEGELRGLSVGPRMKTRSTLWRPIGLPRTSMRPQSGRSSHRREAQCASAHGRDPPFRSCDPRA